MDFRSSELQHLLHEVDEQSAGCDVTVKFRDWTRKFHWKVLSSIPLFDGCRKYGMTETQTGLVELREPSLSQDSIEAAILFLYDNDPAINNDSIHDLLNAAEFLLLSDLKIVCTDWLRHLQLTLDNFFQVLLLNDQFRLGLAETHFTKYLRMHLPQLLQRKQKETLIIQELFETLLFQDGSLSYTSGRRWSTYAQSLSFLFTEINTYEQLVG